MRWNVIKFGIEELHGLAIVWRHRTIRSIQDDIQVISIYIGSNTQTTDKIPYILVLHSIYQKIVTCWSTYLIVFFQLIFHFFTFLSRMIPLFSFVILPRRNKAITRSVLHLNGGQITRVFLELPKQKKSYLTFWSFNNDILQFASKYTR
jgi:hypothetical protein